LLTSSFLLPYAPGRASLKSFLGLDSTQVLCDIVGRRGAWLVEQMLRICQVADWLLLSRLCGSLPVCSFPNAVFGEGDIYSSAGFWSV